MGGGGGGGGWDNWVGINFCHPEVAKMQQQCYMQNTIFDNPPTGSILFFLGEGECQYILETATGELEGENENDNPVRKCSSITLH